MAVPNSPGWYPAPDGNGQQWWNGAGWSETRRSADGSTPGLPGYTAAPPAGPPAPPAPPPAAPAMPTPLGAPNPYAQQSAAMPAAGGQRAATNPALLGVIFSAIGLFAFGPLGIVGIVLGVRELRKAPTGSRRTLAIVAIIGGAVGVFFGIVQFVFFVVGATSFNLEF